jgi:DNA-binding transcriptional MerR regulator
MTITVSQLAAEAGVSPHTVRYYEQVGLLPSAERTAAGYRLYGREASERLRFIKGARRLGLRIAEVRELLAVHDRGLCPCGHAEVLVRRRLTEIEDELERLGQLRRELTGLLERYPAEACSDEEADAWPCADEFIRAGGDASGRAPVPADA